ncbi:MAG TPA: glycosyltransferase family 2 protein [Candidatus Syntrophosphaera sp.]|nr:glycosyltransferase family 2 protein [Candidatus Cloacimonadota bacterium]HOR02725.1 glycosyltransferase family 2 protein [Candidatus Syntrophosphaera sp.]
MFKSITVLIPVFNDQEVLPELHRRLKVVLDKDWRDYEMILVDDGSGDSSWQGIEALHKQDDRIVGIRLMRNFGQQNAIAAGLDYAGGDVVVIMDSDLQDRPEDIPRLVQALEENDASMAIARWKSRKDSWFKLAVSRLFYSVSKKITNIRHEPNLAVFRAIKREVIEELRKYPEKTSTTLSLLYWIGVDYVAVDLERDPRFAGKSGYSLKKMIKLTADRIFSFSMFPIRAAILAGTLISALSFFTGMVLIIRRVMGLVAPGWTSMIVLTLFLFGLNFLFLGVVGEYLGRIFLESKQRPKYIVKKVLGNKCKM